MYVKNGYTYRVSTGDINSRDSAAVTTDIVTHTSVDWDHEPSKPFWTYRTYHQSEWARWIAFTKSRNVNAEQPKRWKQHADDASKLIELAAYGPDAKPNSIANGTNVFLWSWTSSNVDHAKSTTLKLIEHLKSYSEQ